MIQSRRLSKLRQNSHRLMLALAPVSIIDSRARRRLVQHFADKIGLVYFGAVSHESDEHSLVRGVTLSPHHYDNHYCIGSFDGYDMTFVERSAILRSKRKTKQHIWHILAIDLRTPRDIPHAFLGSHSHSELFYDQLLTTQHSFRKMPHESLVQHAGTFTSQYSIFAAPSQYSEISHLLTAEVTNVIGSHFSPLAIEITGDVLYVYSDQQNPTMQLFNTMLKNGLWLAKYIESRA